MGIYFIDPETVFGGPKSIKKIYMIFYLLRGVGLGGFDQCRNFFLFLEVSLITNKNNLNL